jgi:hypothetical protein
MHSPKSLQPTPAGRLFNPRKKTIKKSQFYTGDIALNFPDATSEDFDSEVAKTELSTKNGPIVQIKDRPLKLGEISTMNPPSKNST